MVNEIIAYCGLDCAKCEAFLATQKNDRAELERVAQKWSEGDGHTHPKLTAEDVTCDGCFGKRISKYARSYCAIRACGIDKKVKNCAYCDDYQCEKIAKFLQNTPTAAEKLDTIRRSWVQLANAYGLPTDQTLHGYILRLPRLI
jgi:hypothetical protein